MSLRGVLFHSAVLAAIVMPADRAAAQTWQTSWPAGSAGISGQVLNAGAGPLIVQLCERNGGGCYAESDVLSNGTFQFSRKPERDGVYDVRVLRAGRLVHAETHWLDAQRETLSLHLPNQGPAARANEATVSLARLLHAPPPKAQRLYNKASEAAARGDEKAATRLLEEAIERHPEFIEARNNLAGRLIRAQRFEDAVVQLEAVLELDPRSAMSWANLAAALRKMGDAAGAERAAKRAVEEQPQSAQAHFALALALLDQDKDLERAAASFEHASQSYPVAQILRAQALLGTGDVGGARVALTRFLNAGAAR